MEKIFVNFTAKQRNIKTVNRLLNHIDSDKVEKALEIGCGAGKLSSYLMDEYNWNMTGIDLDTEQIEKAKKNHGGSEYLKFIESDVNKLPFQNKDFDLVIMVDALHHIPNHNKALSEICRVIESNGLFVLIDFAFPRFFGKYSISMDEIINQMEKNDFKIIYHKKPKSITGWRFNVIFQKNNK
jgi:ubiquinone/menaquinone biosynthesis C-methylase UbiE